MHKRFVSGRNLISKYSSAVHHASAICMVAEAWGSAEKYLEIQLLQHRKHNTSIEKTNQNFAQMQSSQR
jgi:hypothetical protein